MYNDKLKISVQFSFPKKHNLGSTKKYFKAKVLKFNECAEVII